MDLAEDSAAAAASSSALEMPLAVARASSSASAINASLRARGASLSVRLHCSFLSYLTVPLTDASLRLFLFVQVPGLDAALTVSGKTPKAVVSDDEEEDRDRSVYSSDRTKSFFTTC